MGDFVSFLRNFFRISGIQAFLGSVPGPQACKASGPSQCTKQVGRLYPGRLVVVAHSHESLDAVGSCNQLRQAVPRA